MLHLVSVVALPIFLLSLGVLAIRGNLISASPIIIGCQLGGLAFMVWARFAFPKGSFRVSAKPAGSEVIHRGPYRFIRHPMYAGAAVLLWASVAGHLSTLSVVIALVPTAAVLGKIVAEERYLRARYPDYAEYSRSTKRLVPFVF